MCNRDASSYDAFHSRHKETDAKVLGISVDGKSGIAEARDFVHRHKVEFDNLLIDLEELVWFYEGLTSSQWIGTPTFLVFGPEGNLQAKQAGAIPVNLIEMFLEQNSSS